ncbi:MAG: MtrB/PioB family outer membrane beta-barrel protein [Acidobacteriota bacterium]
MRAFHAFSLAALALAPVVASAQPAASDVATRGSVDVGVRGSSISGDGARYERYRDLGNGLFLDGVRINRETSGWVFDLRADHIGRRDQRFLGQVVRPGTFKGFAFWDQIPTLMSLTTKTLFTEDFGTSPGVLTISDAIQTQGQASAASLVQLFADNAVGVTTRSRRYRGGGRFEYLATPELTIRTEVQHTDRQGTLPYGGSFGHSSLVEFPAPLQHRLTDVDASAEFARDPVLLRVGYAGSFFNNDVTAVTYDNPFRLVDIAGTSARGRNSLPPSNSFYSVNGMASVKMPARSRATAYVSVGHLSDAGAPLMSQTINAANTVAALERDRVNGEARTAAVNLTFVSRPARFADLNLRYRLYEYDNRTPVFTMTERVAYDNTPSRLAVPIHTEPFGVLRHTLDADFRVTAARFATPGVGFSRLQEERTHRIFESTTDNTLRVFFDSVGHRWFSLRSKFEHAERRGTGIDEGERFLASIGEQPGMRHFDIAPRDRDRVTVLGSVAPTGELSLFASLAAGKDDYRLELPRTTTTTDSLFGLRDNTHRVLSVGMDAVPAEEVTIGASYAYERYNALNRSRQASPGVQFTDPTRNWSAEGTDRVHSLMLNAGVSKIADKVDLNVSYDFNRARAVYEYMAGTVAARTLPEETTVANTLPTPTALPIVKSDLGRGMVDLLYAVTARVGLGVSYWYERYRVTDFTLDAEASPELARGSAVLLGYLYRPYTANTVWARMVYRW